MKQLSISIILCLSLQFTSLVSQASHSVSSDEAIIKANALEVLQVKCNACHKVQHPSKYFELENMNGFAKKIQRQVFLWKRMPKGKEYTLLDFQKETLITWINNQLNNK